MTFLEEIYGDLRVKREKKESVKRSKKEKERKELDIEKGRRVE